MLAAAILGLPAPVLAQDTAAGSTSPETAAEASAPTLSGYAEGDALEGGDSVTQDLAEDDRDVGAVLRFPNIENFCKPWFDAKRRLNEKYGPKLNFSYQAL